MKYVSPQTEKRKQQQQKRKKQMLIGVLAVALVVLITIIAAVVFGGKDKEKPNDSVIISGETQAETTPQPQITQQPENDESGSEDAVHQETDKPAKADKKTKKNKVSIFGRIKSMFSKTEAMPQKFPVMAFGRNIEEAAESIISLSPMATEFILSSPSQNALTAVSNYCNKYSFDQLMTVGTPLLSNVDKIIQIAPDVVVVQTPLSDVDRIKLEESGILVLQLNAPDSFEDVKEIYRSVTALTQGSEIATFEAERVTASIQKKLGLYAKALEKSDKKDAVMVFNSYGMVATKDTFEADILANFFDISIDGRNYYNEDFTAVAASNPQVIIASDYMSETDIINMGFGDSDAFVNSNIFYVNIQQFESCSAKAIDILCGIANTVYGDEITVQITAETTE